MKKLIKKIKNILTKPRKIPIDMNDFLFLSGLILLFVGLYMYNPWIAPTVTGLIMLLTGLFGKK